MGNAALEFDGAAEMPVTKLGQIGGSMPEEREGGNGGWRRQLGVGVRGAAAAHL